MAGKGQHVDVAGRRVNRIGARCLSRVHQYAAPIPVSYFRNSSNGGYGAGHVGGVVYHDQFDFFFFENIREGCRVHQTFPVCPDGKYFYLPALLQVTERAHHAVMLHGGGDNLVPLFQKTVYGYVEAFGDVFSEDDPGAVFDLKKPRQQFAGIEDQLAGLYRQPVAAPAGAPADVEKIVRHGLNHRFGLGKTGGGVIKVNHPGTAPPLIEIIQAPCLAMVLLLAATSRTRKKFLWEWESIHAEYKLSRVHFSL
ncbi:MAG: hypothetical protein A4E53_00264 [Pelotomaculum sp. PtaB.Bin104]|nr:MAG: hypothetical protein A4E53_00264 [Pelotomaculum sp. PtaB.Bin104]